ncbi:folliculin-interacting protein N-terminus-domain-containing protein [Cladorrhinum samala]|uniref:Folliculin-interacting protein N-terminus-domain-containing protein n=1 Tax=Cladorrhinum samala TaxID=585594 RepID=A0AAV9HNU5_9PEZI|nr:folliculin-interacting protein N-terminus-domain-containing protein [Cladorrhinum samala]
MLGKLFNLGAGSGAGALPSAQTPSHKPFSLESVQEDIHTRNLLFPDPHDLYEHRLNQFYPLSSGLSPLTSPSTNAFDYNGDIELDVRDVRIIIMQDALSSVAASLLYDSQPAPPVSPAYVDRPSATAGSYSVQEPRRTPVSPRKPSITSIQRPIVIQPGSPKARQGAFDRRPSVHSRNQGYTETDSQRAWREYREELATFSSCIFGNSELMAYKGTSTKVHVVPSEMRPIDHASMFSDGRSSMGRSSMRASRLSQSFSSENPPPLTSPPTAGVASRTHDRKKVLITRLFPVNLPLDEDLTPPDGNFTEENTGYPFPKPADDLKVKKKLKQKRTPMYAVALVISLPPTPSHHAPANSGRSAFKTSSSYQEQDSFPSSFNSARRAGWTMIGGGGTGGYGQDSFETSFSSDMEDQIDSITQHWDIIMRTLSHLQTTVASTLFTMLRQADMTSPDPLPAIHQMARASSVSGRRGDDATPMKPPKTNAKYVTLLPNCLLDNRYIKDEIDAAKTRIVAGIRASRVTTGQNRWPIWREEARRMAKWAGGREQGFFIYTLLTGFLSTHTDWLQALSPYDYRGRYFSQKQSRAEEDALVPARTIIVSDNKITARRLVFLLAAFLPATQQIPGARAHRPSTSTSMGALSQSPPSFVVPILKEESLRRKINRRPGSRVPSHSRNLSVQSGTRGTGIPPSLNHLSMESRHERRASDATSIRTAHLPIRGGDATRKISAATTATITPETSVPHFSTAQRPDLFSQGRPGSGSSVAADDLKRLTRDESAERRQSSRWSVISGFWGTQRRKSVTKIPELNDERNSGYTSVVKSRRASAARPSATLDRGLAKGSESGSDKPENSQGSSTGPRDSTTPPRTSGDTLGLSDSTGATPKLERIPDPSGAFESPVKTSINDDGVIDVDIPLPDFLTTFESAVSSPSSSGYLSAPGFGSGLESFEQSRFSLDGDATVNAAGFLQHYHPDFVLQAVPPQDDLIKQIKASMRAEPTPQPSPPSAHPGGADAAERWVDVSSAIVADATTFTVTRITYRRLVRPRSSADRTFTPTPSPNAARTTTPTAHPYEMQVRDEFIEELVVSLDETLLEAIDKVIAAGGADMVSKNSSTCSSRSTSKRRDRSNSTSTQGDVRSSINQGLVGLVPDPPPRSKCKTVLLGALEDIIQDVIHDRRREQEVGIERSSPPLKAKESILREAVRGWLRSVDSGDC